MEVFDRLWLKILILAAIILLCLYSISIQNDHHQIKQIYTILNKENLKSILKGASPVDTQNITTKSIHNTTFTASSTTATTSTTASTSSSTVTRHITPEIITTTKARITTLDPAELLMERPSIPERVEPKSTNGSIAVFIFHTRFHILAGLQIYMLRRLAINLVNVELFLDGDITEQMQTTADQYGARVFSFPQQLHVQSHGASDRNTHIVNWALATRAKSYLNNGTAVLLLDGDVFPLSPFDSASLLNSRRLVCRKHPATWTRYCWIGFICLSPEMASTIHEFDVSQTARNGKGYDSGGKTVEYLLKYPNASYAYMRETIFIEQNKNLFWGALDVDIGWVHNHFSRCDKCGPEIFFSPFSDSNAVFYHMISATSEWRFGYQGERLQSIFNSLMKSPYGPNSTMAVYDIMESVKKVQKMPKIPVFGNLTCERVCIG